VFWVVARVLLCGC